MRRPSLWEGKVILAPMVRVGTLPMRLLALHHGASLVYSPEIVDKSIIGSERLVDPVSGTIDYRREGRLIFRTHPAERERLVFQIGSSDAALAVQAALTVQQDVAAIDLNCGCPKRFSLQAGMGAALLRAPEKLTHILRALVKGCTVPVSAKIRLFLPPELSATEALLRGIMETGVSAVAIHARDPSERSERHPAHWDLYLQLARLFHQVNEHLYPDAANRTALILNGDVGLKEGCSYAAGMSLKRILQESSTKSVMLARAAQWNPSIFRVFSDWNGLGLETGPCRDEILGDFGVNGPLKDSGTEPLSVLDVSRQYISIANATANHSNNTKYVLQQIWNQAAATATGNGRAASLRRVQALQRTRSTVEICSVFGVEYLEGREREDEFEMGDETALEHEA
jgi:tRNA-dihydrouridine synthase